MFSLNIFSIFFQNQISGVETRSRGGRSLSLSALSGIKSLEFSVFYPIFGYIWCFINIILFPNWQNKVLPTTVIMTVKTLILMIKPSLTIISLYCIREYKLKQKMLIKYLCEPNDIRGQNCTHGE